MLSKKDPNVTENVRGVVTRRSYVIGLVVLLASGYSQYVIRGLGPILGFLVVYGVPVFATGLISGSLLIKRALNRIGDATKFGLGFFGAFSVLNFLMSIAILYALAVLDPSAVKLLNRPNPVLDIPPEFAWIMVWISFLVVGPAEEYLFRGFVFGGMLSIFGDRHWLVLAFASSILFAIVHLYYAVVYGVASIIAFTDLVTFGMAMAVTYYLSGGNLLIPAIIHGAYDATGFLGVATSPELGTILRMSMMAFGVAFGILLLIQRARKRI
jgi:membrane protease YdiL (CAAX protease family)